MTQDLAVALGRDWQPMFEIPRRKTAFGLIVTKLDLTFLQRLSIRGAQDRHQKAGPCSVRQYVPVDVKRHSVQRGWSPFQHVEPPRVIGEMHADMVGNEIE